MVNTKIRRGLTFLLLGLITTLVLSSCALSNQAAPRWLVVATSQELVDSGFTAAITSQFEKSYNVHIKWLTVSSCQALTYINQDSRIDVLLISGGNELDEPVQANTDFCKNNLEASTTSKAANYLAGPGPTIPPYKAPVVTPTPTPTLVINAKPTATPTALPINYLLAERQIVFWDPLVLVGPPTDPLHLENSDNIAKALKTIGEANGPFLVAGQEPGIVKLEEVWWKLVGTGELKLRGIHYKVVDGDAHATLVAAEASESYTVVPLDVYLTFHNNNKSVLIFANDPSMFISYESMVHNSTRCGSCDLLLGREFLNYLSSLAVQSQILNLGQSKFKQAFYRSPNFRVYRPQ